MPSVIEVQVHDRLAEVQDRISAAAQRSGRDPNEIRIVAVTKSHPHQIVEAAYEAGLRIIGENRVEEALPKHAAVSKLADIEWHMIGHIQSRKAANVAQSFDFVHSIDRIKIARRLDQAADNADERLPVLIECNVSGEASKWGWPATEESSWSTAAEEFSEVCSLPNLEVRGLMTMAPMVADPENVRQVFRKLRQFRDFLTMAVPGDWSELSMGMSDDYEVAVEEGATLVRIGRAIFGPRSNG